MRNTATFHSYILVANFQTIGSAFKSVNCIWERQLNRNNIALGKENK